MEPYRRDKAMILSVLRLFGALPYSILHAWAKYFYRIELRKETLTDLSQKGYIYFDKENEYVFLYRGSKANLRTEVLAYVLIKLLDKGCDNVAKARYPFDYLFSVKESSYVLIDFENEGESKLRIMRNMDNPYSLSSSFVPVIVLREGNEHKLALKDMDGKYELIPSCDYILACYKYNPLAPEYNRYTVKFYEKTAGTI